MKALSFIRDMLREVPRLLVINVAFMLALGMADILSVVSVAPVVDVLLDPKLTHPSPVTARVAGVLAAVGLPATLTTLMVAFILLNILRNGAYVAASYVGVRTKYAFGRRLIVGTFDDFFRSRWSFFAGTEQGLLLNTFNREITVVTDAFIGMTTMMTVVIEAALFLVVPFVVSWQVAAAALFWALLIGAPFVLLGRVAYPWGQASTRAANAMSSAIAENLGAAKLVLGFGNQRESTARLADAWGAFRRAAVKAHTLNLAIPATYFPLALSVLGVALFIARRTGVSLGNTAVILYSFLRVVPMIGQAIGYKNQLENALPSWEQVTHLREVARELKPTSGTRPFERLAQGVTFEDVSFRYEGREPVLSGIDARVPRGKMVALVGPSGVGKSTFVDLLIGLIEPTSGRIMVDGVPLSELDPESYRHRIGYVPQDPVLFNTSIKENLLWACPDAADQDIARALGRANAAEFIEHLPEGLETIVGDRGVRLSGGQVQRIALARALVRGPEILVLDEATSALDSRSEQLIQQAIDSLAGELTMVVIAHRVSTVSNADVVYVLGDGRVLEEGSFAELAARPDSYLSQAGQMQGHSKGEASRGR
jgi:ABC-type multidrug transport system fused ATPase/permease subunit